MWNKTSLQRLLATRMQDYQLIVVANREPYIHKFQGERIACLRPASGMATALDPILRACGGVWVGHGSGDADRLTVDAHDHVAVPPEDPSYTLRRVWLSRHAEEGFYHGLSNSAIWPLCHIVYTRPVYESSHWQSYVDVNRAFAEAVIEEAGDRPTFVFIQDYHFGLLPRMLKELSPALVVAQFWHIPWPNPETFGTFPWKVELLDGLLGNDLLGFHLRSHCQNFLDAVHVSLESKVDWEANEVTRGGHVSRVRPFPISIDYERQAAESASERVNRAMDEWSKRLHLEDGLILGAGIERLDYTKGIPERLRAFDLLLRDSPEYRDRLVFVQVGVPSRSHIKEYREIEAEVDELVEEINWRWGHESWQPIVAIKEHCGPVDMMALHRLSRFFIVSALHDGMNLVAKEFVASRVDEDGVLILSQFTGSARELTDALLVNPYAVDEIVGAIRHAIDMPAAERQRRMRRMREAVAGNNVYRWAGKIINALLNIEPGDVTNGDADESAGSLVGAAT
jgi:trehalose 6-phosphate synthase